MWYLIVSIPDLCPLTYFDKVSMHFDNVIVAGGDNVMVAGELNYDCLDIDKSKTMKLFMS